MKEENISICDATCEQLHAFRYQISLGENQHHEIMGIEKIIKDLNVEAFEKSFEILIRRHESLRSYFQINNGEIKQCIIPYDKDIFNVHYYNKDDIADDNSFISNTLDECKRSFKIDAPPLLKCLIFNIDHEKFLMCLLMPHIISDERSCRLILQELRMYYDSFKNGKSIEVLPLKMQISEYSLRQKKWMEKNEDRICNYWHNKLETILNQKKQTIYKIIDGNSNHSESRKDL